MGGGCCVGNCCVMNNAVGNFFRNIFGSSSCGYHPGPSENEKHAKKIADELAEMKKNIRESSQKKEEEMIDYINKSMNDLFELLEKVNQKKYGGKTLNIDIEGIRAKNEELKKEVVGHIGNYMDDRLVLTDPELSIILEERDDKKRGKNFDNFCMKIQNQSLEGLCQKIEDTVQKQEDMIRHEIEARLKEVDKNMQAVTKAYTDIVAIKEQDDSKMDEERMKYMYKHEIIEILLEQLGEREVGFEETRKNCRIRE